jgi:hypothetical protein
MADASQLTDEELNKVIETGVEPQEETPEAPPEPQKESEVIAPPAEEPLKEEPEAPVTVPANEEPEETPAAPSRREQLRVEDLLRKYGPPKETPRTKTGKDYRELIDAEDEVIKALESDRTQATQESYNQGLERAQYFQWETLLQVDEPAIRIKHPELDPTNKEKYHPVLRRAMDAKYAAFVGYDPGDPEKGIARSVRNPSIRYSEFVESELEFADEIASQRVERTTQNIAKQTAQTALRPDGSSAKRLDLNKAPEDMTLEELYAVTGGTPPPKSK